MAFPVEFPVAGERVVVVLWFECFIVCKLGYDGKKILWVMIPLCQGSCRLDG